MTRDLAALAARVLLIWSTWAFHRLSARKRQRVEKAQAAQAGNESEAK